MVERFLVLHFGWLLPKLACKNIHIKSDGCIVWVFQLTPKWEWVATNALKGLLSCFGKQKYFTVQFYTMRFPQFWGKPIPLQNEKLKPIALVLNPTPTKGWVFAQKCAKGCTNVGQLQWLQISPLWANLQNVGVRFICYFPHKWGSQRSHFWECHTTVT